MKRYTFIILFVLVLITPIALRWAIGVTGSASVSHDTPRVVVITPNVEGIKREFADAFSDWHRKKYGTPAIVDYRAYGGGGEIIRFFRSGQAMNSIDAVWGGGPDLFTSLKKFGYLQSLDLREQVLFAAFPDAQLNGTKLYDDTDFTWFGTALSTFGIIYNRDVLRYLHVPELKTWTDLTDARLSNWFIAGDPTRSASARIAFMIIIERAMIDAKNAGRTEDDGWADGMGTVRLICANARYFTDAGQSVPNVVATGDAAVGTAIDFFARSQVDAVGDDRMGYLEPVGATSISIDPVAVVKDAPHAEIAKHFVEFLLSSEGQRLWIVKAGAPGGPKSTSLRRLPIVREVYRDQTDFTDHVDPFNAQFAFASSPARTKTYGIVGELIETSCMSLLDELRETRLAIERSPKRDELMKRFAKFPFDQQEALRKQAEFDKASPLEKLAIKRKWREEFRLEYERLRKDSP